MKVSTSLLQIIAAAVIASSATSCANTEKLTPHNQEKTTISTQTPTTPNVPVDNCPACGMG